MIFWIKKAPNNRGKGEGTALIIITLLGVTVCNAMMTFYLGLKRLNK